MAAALYAPEPDTSELAAFGLTAEDFEDEAVQIWPDTAAALALFSRLGTQWRIGMGYSPASACRKTKKTPCLTTSASWNPPPLPPCAPSHSPTQTA